MGREERTDGRSDAGFGRTEGRQRIRDEARVVFCVIAEGGTAEASKARHRTSGVVVRDQRPSGPPGKSEYWITLYAFLPPRTGRQVSIIDHRFHASRRTGSCPVCV